MTDLDKRVATLRGWAWDSDNEWWIDTDGAVLLGSAAYLPSTNLWQAVALWNEARPEGWRLTVQQMETSDKWRVRTAFDQRATSGYWAEPKYVLLADLPRAITEAWCEAMEGK